MLMTMLMTLAATPALSTDWPDVSSPPTRSTIGKDDVVLIAGVGRSFVLPEIPGATDIATDWYRFFVDGRGVDVENAVLLRDGDVTKESLLAEAERLRARKKSKGAFWIVFVGHGAPNADGSDGLLLGVDVQPTIRSIQSRGLSQNELLRAAGATAKDGNVVAIFDACFSGVGSDGSGRPLVPGAQATLPVRRDASSMKATVLQASEEVAGPLPGHNRPAFSYLLLGASRGWGDDDGDGVVQLKEAFAWTKKALSVTVRDRSQVPTMRGDADVVLLKGARERGPQLTSVVAARLPPSPRPKPTSADADDDTDTFDRVSAEAAFARRRLAATSSGFVRGVYAAAVDEGQVLSAGEKLSPDAAKTVAEVAGKHTLAVAGGLGVGAGAALVGGIVGGGVGASVSGGVAADGAGAATAVAAGAVIGAIPGVLIGLVTWGVLSPSPEDDVRLAQARSDLAEAINVSERRRLGLDRK
jgi:hypothetical protein